MRTLEGNGENKDRDTQSIETPLAMLWYDAPGGFYETNPVFRHIRSSLHPGLRAQRICDGADHHGQQVPVDVEPLHQ